MVCPNIYGECRCYTYKGDTEQFCAKRRGPHVVSCDPECCVGGCVDDGSRPAYRVIERPVVQGSVVYMWILLILGVIISLKITFVR
jgi:hypothetical protein